MALQQRDAHRAGPKRLTERHPVNLKWYKDSFDITIKNINTKVVLCLSKQASVTVKERIVGSPDILKQQFLSLPPDGHLLEGMRSSSHSGVMCKCPPIGKCYFNINT